MEEHLTFSPKSKKGCTFKFAPFNITRELQERRFENVRLGSVCSKCRSTIIILCTTLRDATNRKKQVRKRNMMLKIVGGALGGGEKKRGTATIEAKPQIKHVMGDVTRFTPTALKVKRVQKDAKGRVIKSSGTAPTLIFVCPLMKVFLSQTTSLFYDIDFMF